MTRPSCFLTLLIVASFAVAQTEFSADVVPRKKGAKVYFGKDKIRIEACSWGCGVDYGSIDPHFYILVDKQPMHARMRPQMANERDPYDFLGTDVENGCCRFLAELWNQGGTCHKVGSDTVNGRATVKYEGTNAKGESETIRIDTKLRFPVKWQRKNWDGGFAEHQRRRSTCERCSRSLRATRSWMTARRWSRSKISKREISGRPCLSVPALFAPGN